MLPNLVGRATDASLGWLWPSWRSKANRGQIQWITYVLPIWYLVSRWGLGPKVCMHHFGCGMNWIKGYYMIVKVKNETFWFSTYSMEMHSLTSSSFIICLWGETFGSRTILFALFCFCFLLSVFVFFCCCCFNLFLRLRGHYTTNQKVACFVLHLKIIYTFLKNDISILSKLSTPFWKMI